MSFGATKLLSASGGKAYEIDQSIMLDAEDAPKLRRTPSSEGNRKTWTKEMMNDYLLTNNKRFRRNFYKV